MTVPSASPSETSTRDVFALVFGILSFNGCPVLGAIVAIVLAQGSSSGVARAGSILGWVNPAICALALVVGLIFLVVAGVASQF